MRRLMLFVCDVAMAVVLVSAASGSAGSGQSRWVMTDLGRLGVESSATALNDRGQVVGVSGTGMGFDHAFLWEKGRMRDLGTLGGRVSGAAAINERGQVAGSSETARGARSPLGERHAFLWQRGRMTDLGTLAALTDEGRSYYALAINERGQILGMSGPARSQGEERAFVWWNGRMTGNRDLIRLAGWGLPGTGLAALNDRGQVVGANSGLAVLWYRGRLTALGALPGGGLSHASAINERGQIVGGSEYGGQIERHAVLWSDGRIADLGTLGMSESDAVDINERGQITGDCDSGDYKRWRAFLWQKGRMIGLGTLGGQRSEAVAINERGQIIGSSTTETGARHAFVWQSGRMTDLGTLAGGRESGVAAINDRGQIVG